MDAFISAEIYILTIFFTWFEILQIRDKGWMYLGDITNIVDVASACVNITLIVKEDFFHDELYDLAT